MCLKIETCRMNGSVAMSIGRNMGRRDQASCYNSFIGRR